MQRLLMNLSIKAGLTGVLVTFTVLIAVVAFLGYKSNTMGELSITELNTFNSQLNELNRAQVNAADTQLSFLNHLDSLNEGQAILARQYLEAGEQFLNRANERFAAYVAVPKSEQGQSHADTLEEIFKRLMEFGLEPQLAALQRADEQAYRAAKREGDLINCRVPCD